MLSATVCHFTTRTIARSDRQRVDALLPPRPGGTRRKPRHRRGHVGSHSWRGPTTNAATADHVRRWPVLPSDSRDHRSTVRWSGGRRKPRASSRIGPSTLDRPLRSDSDVERSMVNECARQRRSRSRLQPRGSLCPRWEHTNVHDRYVVDDGAYVGVIVIVVPGYVGSAVVHHGRTDARESRRDEPWAGTRAGYVLPCNELLQQPPTT